MPAPGKLAELKKKVSATLLKNVKGVSGVGLPMDEITVYLEEDTPEIRAAVVKAVEPLKLPVALHWQVTGKFQR